MTASPYRNYLGPQSATVETEEDYPSTGGKVERRILTVNDAHKLLRKNIGNRSVSDAHVDRLSSEVVHRWKYNADPIRVAIGGRLLDGQHRLYAVIATNTPIDTAIITDLPEEVMMSIDTGRKRTISDYLTFKEHNRPLLIGAACRLVFNYLSGKSLSVPTSPGAVEEFISERPRILRLIEPASDVRGICPVPSLIAILFLATEDPRYDLKVLEFIDGLASGANMEEGDPRIALARTYASIKAKKGYRLSETISFSLTAKGWNAFALERQTSRFNITGLSGDVGKTIVPDVVGGPPRGAGLSSLIRK